MDCKITKIIGFFSGLNLFVLGRIYYCSTNYFIGVLYLLKMHELSHAKT